MIPEITDYDLLRRIGKGAYGEVWLARSATGQYRAVKVVRREHFQYDAPFERELKGIERYEPLSRSSECLVDVLHVGLRKDLGYFFYVMELADDLRAISDSGPNQFIDPNTYIPATLTAVLENRLRLSLAARLELGLAITSGLAYLHSQAKALVHRDVSPGNILFVRGKPKLADPGTVVRLAEAKSITGTIGYLAPEGSNSKPSDIYSAGKVLYVANSGLPPEQFPELPESLRGTEEWIGILEVNQVVIRACDPDPRKRYPSADAMREDLMKLRSGFSLRQEAQNRRRVQHLKRGVAITGAAFLAAVFGWAAYRSSTRAELELQRTRLASQTRELRLTHRMLEAEHRLAFERVDEYFGAGKSSEGLTELTRILRSDPNNYVAASRLISALTDRNFPLPVFDPLRHQDEVYLASFSPGGRRILTASRDGTARIWDAETGRPLTEPLRHLDEVRFASFSPDGKWIVTASLDHTARLWDSATGRPVGQEMRHQGQVNRAYFSPDGKWVATASKDGTARLWDSSSGEPHGSPMIHNGEVNECDFSPDSRWLVTASHDASVRRLEFGIFRRGSYGRRRSSIWTTSLSLYSVLTVLES
ncbi:MAG: WD40 repeat domain-containing serine/threonine-protein kinase [Verrucomicrobiales bacterium]|nr:WD40 repeat domain-containing serine/threonine-protein kinase [Verrucomicrobiales bacterium]